MIYALVEEPRILLILVVLVAIQDARSAAMNGQGAFIVMDIESLTPSREHWRRTRDIMSNYAEAAALPPEPSNRAASIEDS